MNEGKKGHGPMYWLLVIVGVAVALFIGSAIVNGISQANARQELERKAQALTSVNGLQQMILAGIKKDKRGSGACWYLAAIGYRLAEARDLKIDRFAAIELANEKYLVEELAKNGFNSKAVIGGVAANVYDSPLPPAEIFSTQREACVRGRPV